MDDKTVMWRNRVDGRKEFIIFDEGDYLYFKFYCTMISWHNLKVDIIAEDTRYFKFEL